MIDSSYNNTENPADLPEEQASQSIVKVFCSQIKGSRKTTKKREPVDVPSIIPMNERKWIDIEPGNSSFSAYEISKKVINLLRHSQTVQREDDGAVQFWRIKNFLQNQFPQSNYWSDDRWKACLSAGGGAKRRYQYCTDISGTIIYFRALQGHSGRNLIEPSLQDNAIIQSGFFQQIYHVGCAFNLLSIINNGLIPGGQNSSKRQTVFFLPSDPRDKGHQDPATIDFNKPRRAQYMHSAWKKHQDAVFWVDISLAIQKGLTFCQTRSNAIIFQGTLPAYCIPNVMRLKTGEVFYEKSYMSPRPPPKISLRHDHDWTRGKVQLGSKLINSHKVKLFDRFRGEAQHETFSQPTQPIPKPIRHRSGQPEDTQGVFVVKGETSRSREIDEKGFHEKLCVSDGSGQPEITISVMEARSLSENTRVEQTHDGSGQPDECNNSSAHTVKEQHALDEHREIASFNTNNEFNRAINEENIDFNVPGAPHSTVKQLHGASVQDLIQKIENHPNRHALQRDLQQSQSFNPFSQESKMIHEVGNVELCEVLDMEPKAQSKVSYWGRGHRLLHVRTLLAQRNGGEQKICPIHHGSPLDSELLKGDTHGHRYGKKPGDCGYFVANSLKKKCQEEEFLGSSTTRSSATRNSARICLTSVALKNYVVKWTNWRTKTTRTTSLQKKLVCTATIGGSVRTQLVPIRCQ